MPPNDFCPIHNLKKTLLFQFYVCDGCNPPKHVETKKKVEPKASDDADYPTCPTCKIIPPFGNGIDKNSSEAHPRWMCYCTNCYSEWSEPCRDGQPFRFGDTIFCFNGKSRKMDYVGSI